MIKLKNLLIVIFTLIVGTASSQGVKTESKSSHELENPIIDHLKKREYIARDYIKLKSGFRYKAEVDDTQPPALYEYTFSGKIDKNLIFETDYVTTVSEFDMDNTAVGSLPGSIKVSSTGAASYSIPIALPSGTADMMPGLSIVYNSQSSDGMLGRGWTIAGFSAITRIPTSIHSDGFVDGVDFDINDRFSIDGQRLVATSGTYGEDGTIYHTEIESFSEITQSGFDGSTSNFTVRTKDGNTLEFGTEGNAHILLGNPEKTLSWLLNKVTDVRGNFYTITYKKINDEVVPTRIDYTGNTSMTPYNSVKFAYSEKRDQHTVYIAGYPVKNSLILDEITIKSNKKIVKQYKFSYEFDKISRLREITLFEDHKFKLNSTKIEWGAESNSAGVQTVSQFSYIDSDLGHVAIPGDYNGDGLTDYITMNYSKDSEGNLQYTPENGGERVLFERWGLYLTKKHGVMNSFRYEQFLASWGAIPQEAIELLPGDFNGDGMSDLLHIKHGWGTNDIYLSLMESNGTGFTRTDFTVNNVFSNSEVKIGDFNGDGKSDWVVYQNSDNGEACDVVIPGPIPFTIESPLKTMDIKIYTTSDSGEPELIGDYLQDGAFSFSIADITGNGKANIILKENVDLCTLQAISETHILEISEGLNLEKINTGNESSLPPGITSFDQKSGDFNGDGKTDILVFSTDEWKWKLYYSTGKDFAEGLAPPLNVHPHTVEMEMEILHYTDFDGNGLTDIIAFETVPETETETEAQRLRYNMYVYYNYAGNFEKEFLRETTMYVGTVGVYSLLTASYLNNIDTNGDGQAEVILIFNDEDFSGYMKCWSFQGQSRTQKNRVISITDGFDNKSEFEYKPLTDKTVYTKNGLVNNLDGVNLSSDSYPIVRIQPPLQVVSKVKTTADADGGTVSSKYIYESALFHNLGKGFLGFAKTRVTGSVYNNLYTENVNRVSQDHFLLLPYSTYKGDSNLGKTTNFTYSFKEQITSNYGTLFPYVSETETDDWTTQIFGVKNTFVYNNWGDLTDHTVENGINNTVVSVNTFDEIIPPSGSIWSWSRLSRTVITKTRESDDEINTRESTFVYDNEGFLTSRVNDPGKEVEITSLYEYYLPYGNIKKATVTAIGEPSRYNLYTYDQETHRFPLTNTNAEGDVTSATFDNEFGNKLTATDINGNITKFTYNKLGALIKKELPDGSISESSVHWFSENGEIYDANIDALYYIKSKSNASNSFSYSYYDKLGRLIQSEKPAFNANEGMNTIVSKIEYNPAEHPKGARKISRASLPYFKGTSEQDIKYTTYEYVDPDLVVDAVYVGNVKKITSPSGESVEYNYDGRLTGETSSSGKFKNVTVNQFGEPWKVEDNSGETIIYNYNASGQPVDVGIEGEAIVFTYDDYGRQLSIVDPDAGTTSYTYDSWGQLKTQKDNNRPVIYNIDYDRVGRILKKERVDGMTNYVYSTESGKKGLLLSESYTNSEMTYNNQITYNYDNLGRISSSIESFGNGTDENEIVENSFLYDGIGRLVRHTYPSGYFYTQEYNDAGYLYQINDKNGTMLWEKEETNALGQTTLLQKGNGVPTITSYDDNNYLENVVSGSFQDMTYQFDPQTGNLESRTENIIRLGNLTGNSENFQYDELNRLEYILKDNEEITTPGVFKMEYSSTGNIEHKPDAGTYAYNTTHKPHAVLQIIGSNAVDIPSSQQDITYTAFNKVKTISEDNKTLSFSYGLGNNRKKTVLEIDNQTRVKHFFGNYETVLDERTGILKRIHYLPGGAVLIKTDNDEEGELLYTYKDHLGSITHITDDSGNLLEEYSYDAWGRMRNLKNWDIHLTPDETSTALSLINGRGYTGHEHLAEFGIINMNGRLYDPVLGRMLSPDNFVQAPDFSQNFNRYSYVYNNPLRYTDPSGEIVSTTLLYMIGGAIVGGYIGGGYFAGQASGTGFEPNPFPLKGGPWSQNDKAGWKGAAVGAIIGGAIGRSYGKPPTNPTDPSFWKVVENRAYNVLYMGFESGAGAIANSVAENGGAFDLDREYSAGMNGFIEGGISATHNKFVRLVVRNNHEDNRDWIDGKDKADLHFGLVGWDFGDDGGFYYIGDNLTADRRADMAMETLILLSMIPDGTKYYKRSSHKKGKRRVNQVLTGWQRGPKVVKDPVWEPRKNTRIKYYDYHYQDEMESAVEAVWPLYIQRYGKP